MKNYFKKYPKGSPSIMGKNWGGGLPEPVTPFRFPEVSYLRIKTDSILEKIEKAENTDLITEDGYHVDFLGFYFFVDLFVEGKKSAANRNYKIEIEPVFLLYKEEGGIVDEDSVKFLSFNEDSDLAKEDLVEELIEVIKQKDGYFNKGGNFVTMETIPGLPSGPSIPKHQTLEFYEEHDRFGFAYISKDEIKLLALMWKYLLISGAKITVGTTFSKDVVEKIAPDTSFFTVKIEGEEWKSEDIKNKFTKPKLRKVALDTDDSVDTTVESDSFEYPQMSFAAGCPPVWNNVTDTHALLVKKGISVNNYAQLAATIRTQWGVFMNTQGVDTGTQSTADNNTQG